MARRRVVKEVKDVGRPTKFTPERCASIIDMISKFVPYKLAAEANGICEETLNAWINDGMCDLKEGIISDKSKFSASIKQAAVDRVQKLTANISEGMDRWQSNAWLLERVHRQHFGADAGVIQELIDNQNKMEQLIKDKLDK